MMSGTSPRSCPTRSASNSPRDPDSPRQSRDPAEDGACIGWARGLFDALAPHATGGVYVNFMPGDEAQRVRQGAYGANYERLARLKARYDPENLFRLNQNIRP